MQEHYTLYMFSKKCTIKRLHISIQTLIFFHFLHVTIIISKETKFKVERILISGHKEHFRVPCMINELLESLSEVFL